MTPLTTLRVNLGPRSYDLRFGTSWLSALRTELAAHLPEGRRLAVITDQNLARLQSLVLTTLITAPGPDATPIPHLILPPGEATKSPAQLAQIWDFLAQHRLDRTSLLLAFGGGVIGDLVGFAAASFLRGLPFLQIPSTLLAMVDSSVGGKTGINLPAGKNLVGAFHQPAAVAIDTALLATLPPRDFAAGMAEVLKYGLLGDPALFDQLTATPLTPSSPELPAVIHRCCALKARIVEADEFETAPTGGRALLNLGHTFGHAIEQVTRYQTYLHGEAVALGLVAATHLSHNLGLLPADALPQVEHALATHHLPTRLHQPLACADLAAAMTRDKKVRSGRLRFVALSSLGLALTLDDVPAAAAAAACRYLGAN